MFNLIYKLLNFTTNIHDIRFMCSVLLNHLQAFQRQTITDLIRDLSRQAISFEVTDQIRDKLHQSKLKSISFPCTTAEKAPKKEREQYRVMRSLRFPIAGEISPSRFKPDRLLQCQKPNKQTSAELKEGKTITNQETFTIKNENDRTMRQRHKKKKKKRQQSERIILVSKLTAQRH